MKKIKSGKLTFVENMIFNQKRYYQELIEGSHVNWEHNMDKEFIKENNRDWREKNVFNWRLAKMMNNKYANKNEINHFIFKDNQIKYVRESFGKKRDLQNEFNLLERDSLCSVRFFEDKNGIAKKTVINFGTTYQANWNADFFIKKEKHITKKILGFNCYKVLVVGLKFIEKELTINYYDMFVTPEIHLPAHCILFLNGFALEECPLEIKITRQGSESMYQLMSATKFEAYDTSNELILPEQYEVIRNDMNLEKPYNHREARKKNRSR